MAIGLPLSAASGMAERTTAAGLCLSQNLPPAEWVAAQLLQRTVLAIDPDGIALTAIRRRCFFKTDATVSVAAGEHSPPQVSLSTHPATGNG